GSVAVPLQFLRRPSTGNGSPPRAPAPVPPPARGELVPGQHGPVHVPALGPATRPLTCGPRGPSGSPGRGVPPVGARRWRLRGCPGPRGHGPFPPRPRRPPRRKIGRAHV